MPISGAISKARCDASRSGSTSTSTKTDSPTSSPRRDSTPCENERTRSCPTPPSARNSQWHELLDGAGRRRYAERVKQLAPPDLIEWVHHEPVGNVSTG